MKQVYLVLRRCLWFFFSTMSSLLRNNAGITYTSVRDLERMGCPLQPSFLYRRLTTSEGRIVMVAVLKLPELCRSARALAWGSSEPSSDKQKHLNSARQHDRAHRYQRKISYNPPKTSPTDILYANRPLRFLNRNSHGKLRF